MVALLLINFGFHGYLSEHTDLQEGTICALERPILSFVTVHDVISREMGNGCPGTFRAVLLRG